MLLKLDILPFVETHATQPSDADALVQDFVDWLIPITIDAARFGYFRDELLLNAASINWTTEWNSYQQSGNDTVVKTQLEKLARKMMQTPEFQLF
jgi:hypothetical protein